jgi:hypothetical protein
MGGPRAPQDRDAAVLRLEGRHPGMATRRRTPTPSVLNREELKEGGKGKRLWWFSRWGGGVVVAGSRTAVAWRSRRSRRCRCPCSGPAPFPDADGSFSFSRAAVEGDVLGGSTASRRGRCPCSGPVPGSSLARRDAAAARFLLSPSRRKQGRWRVENPKGVGGLASVPRLPGALLKGGRKQTGMDFPQCPRPFARKGQVDPVAAACPCLGCARSGH